MYYLQSRYYDPQVGRFINADAFAATGQGLLGNNMFAYCRNNPACRIDASGTADSITYNDGELLSNDELDSRSGGGGPIHNQSFKSFQTSNPFQSRANSEIPHGRAGYDVLPRQGTVIGDPNAPAVDAGSQGKHVTGHNNYIPGRSVWPEGDTGVRQTQEAWMNGTQCGLRPNVRIGVASYGTVVRVHMNGLGWIHGYPIYHN